MYAYIYIYIYITYTCILGPEPDLRADRLAAGLGAGLRAAAARDRPAAELPGGVIMKLP